MRKLLIPFAIVIAILCMNKEEKLVMPKDLIRFRVIANSNSESDQSIKKEVVKEIKPQISFLNTHSLSETRNTIQENMPLYNNIVSKSLQNTLYEDNYSIDYGLHYFPKKEYKGITFEEGNYESLVITIGDGLGENFWCILFPPLCNIDKDKTDYEYTSIVQEIVKKYNHNHKLK
ncbi:MAG: stage II sporulation protein R [Bacilli bacterium]|nr:stage II sporulation protein R [Bacilli bacterium]